MELDSNVFNDAPRVDDKAAQVELAELALNALKNDFYEHANVQLANVFDRKGYLVVADVSQEVAPSPYRTDSDDVFVRVSLVVPSYFLKESGLDRAVKAQAERSEDAERAKKAERLAELEQQQARIAAEMASLRGADNS